MKNHDVFGFVQFYVFLRFVKITVLTKCLFINEIVFFILRDDLFRIINAFVVQNRYFIRLNRLNDKRIHRLFQILASIMCCDKNSNIIYGVHFFSSDKS